MKTRIQIFILALIAFSCSEENLLDTQYSEPLATLNFEGTDQMLDYFNSSLDGQYSAEGISIEKDGKFISFREVYLAAMDELATIETEDQHNQFLNKYSDIISLVDSTYVPRISNIMYQTLCNRKGIYESEGYAHKIIDGDQMVVTSSNNKMDLQRVNSITNLDDSKFRVVVYNIKDESNQNRLANCGYSLEKEYFRNHRKCKKDRKVIAKGYTSYIVSGYNFTPRALAVAYGLKRNGFCNWSEYRTTLGTRNASFTVTASINGSNYDFYESFTDRQSSGDVWDIVLHEGPLNSAIYWSGGSYPSIQFTQFHLEATSRGVGDNWVVLDCH